MALTTKEKEQLRIMICDKGLVKPHVLALYATKTDEQIRAELATFKAKKIVQLTKHKQEQQASLNRTESQIEALKD